MFQLRFSRKIHNSSVNLLKSLQNLLIDLRNTTKRTEKIQIIRRHTELHDFLELFANCGTLGVTWKGVESKFPHVSHSEDTTNKYNDIMALLKDLEGRKITGNTAIANIKKFVIDHEQYRDTISMIIDLDLNAGVGSKTILDALHPPAKDKEEISIDPENVNSRHVVLTHSQVGRNKSFPITSKNLPVALGYPLQHPSIKLDAYKNDHWLISRKLDGIRCLAHCDSADSIRLFTRSGNELNHLPEISSELKRVAEIIRLKNPQMTNFYFDGELCVFLGDEVSDNSLYKRREDDFRTALSIILSRPTEKTIKIDRGRLVYFLFDLIDSNNLNSMILSDRLKIMQECVKDLKCQKIMLLDQYRTKDPFEFRRFLNDKRTFRWEGLIIRRDTQFVGKRSRDIIKVKDFFEAEFDIIDWRMEEMCVQVNGTHRMEKLLSSIKIDFGGKDVWVGSGFTLEERRRYANKPELLRNSQVTVRYFQESQNNKDNLKSLRFPTIKVIHEGRRNL